MINMSSSNIYCAYASYYSYVFAPLCLLIFGLGLVWFYTSSCGLPLYAVLCSFLSFFAAVPACFDMDPSAIYTHIGFYVLSHNKKYFFFYDFYVFASFFVSIKAHFMSTVWFLCRIFAFELYLGRTQAQREFVL